MWTVGRVAAVESWSGRGTSNAAYDTTIDQVELGYVDWQPHGVSEHLGDADLRRPLGLASAAAPATWRALPVELEVEGWRLILD